MEIFSRKEKKTPRPEIYIMGNRNPWRVSIDSKTGFLYWGEVGPMRIVILKKVRWGMMN
jgi:cytochrome c